MIKTDLKLENGFKWFSDKNISVKGFLFDQNNNFYSGEALINYFNNIKERDALENKLNHASGLYTVIIQLDDHEAFIANDIIRSFPIFYSFMNERYLITDEYNSILNKISNPKLNHLSKAEFLAAGFVSGNQTLFNDIYVTQSGQIVHIKNNLIYTSSYFNYSISKECLSEYGSLITQGKKIIDSCFERLMHSIQNRKVIIPLSGGFDSRLIVCKLKELGYTNVLCYSFGKSKNNKEKEISEKVANKLGFEWTFIEYNPDLINDYLSDKIFIEYWEQYSQYSSSFMFQDYFALKYFKDNKLIPDDSIFIPGYSGDFLGGSQLYKNGGIKQHATLKKIAKCILNNRYKLSVIDSNSQKSIVDKIELQLREFTNQNSDLYAYSVFEEWEIKENLSKFIGRAAHIYDFFGYEYRLPYWDMELVSFFKTIPYHFKYGKILYDDILKYHFEKFNVNYDSGRIISPSEFKIFKTKQFIKSIIPSFFKRPISDVDTLNYELILEPIKEELKVYPNYTLKKFKTRNSFLFSWYLKQIEKEYQN
ncbi:asparagine synthase-related protein [Bacteroidota bacterium]